MTRRERRLGVVTCARSDLGIYLPLLDAFAKHPALAAEVVATGMHLSPEFGLTLDHLEAHTSVVVAGLWISVCATSAITDAMATRH